MSLRWVPLDMMREGVTPILLDVLLDVERPPLEHRLPPPQWSLVYDRDGYWKAHGQGLVVVQRAVPWVASLSDPYVLTDPGRALVDRYREAVRALGRPAS